MRRRARRPHRLCRRARLRALRARRSSRCTSTTRCGQRAQPHGIANAGYRAIESCRLEKGYLYWSGDITPDTNPYEAGLGFAVDLDKGDFIGSAALAAIKADGPARKLATFTVDGFVPFHGGEPIMLDGAVVGSVTSGGFGHTSARRSPSATCRRAAGDRKTSTIEAFGRVIPGDQRARAVALRSEEWSG